MVEGNPLLFDKYITAQPDAMKLKMYKPNLIPPQ